MLSDEERGRLARELREEKANAAMLHRELQQAALRISTVADHLRDEGRRRGISTPGNPGNRSLFLPNGVILDSITVDDAARMVDEYKSAVERIRRIESRLT